MNINNNKIFKLAAALSVIFFIYIFIFYFNNSYLPAPFIVNKYDTFMDFYNVFHWGLREGAYTEWNSVYPPLNFIISNIFTLIFNIEDLSGGSVSLRDKINYKIIYLIFTYIISIYIAIDISCNKIFDKNQKILYVLIIFFSAPFLFALERGNLIILAIPFLSIYIRTKKTITKSLAFAILLNIKPYFIVLYFIEFIACKKTETKKDFLFLGAIFSLIVLLITGLVFQQEYYRIPLNLVGFGSQSTLNEVDILALPSTILAFKYLWSVVSIFGSLKLLNYILSGILYFFILKCFLLIYKNEIKDNYLFIFSIIVLTNFSISTGGYGMLFYLPVVPILYQEKLYKIMYIIIFSLLNGLWDVIIIDKYVLEDVGVFLSNKVVQIHQGITLGAVIRPLSNFLILVLFFNILNKVKCDKEFQNKC